MYSSNGECDSEYCGTCDDIGIDRGVGYGENVDGILLISLILPELMAELCGMTW